MLYLSFNETSRKIVEPYQSPKDASGAVHILPASLKNREGDFSIVPFTAMKRKEEMSQVFSKLPTLEEEKSVLGES